MTAFKLKAYSPHRKIEQQYQIAVVNYLRSAYPDVLFTIAPSGMKLSIGLAKKFKALGYKAGTPDLMVFKPYCKDNKPLYHALFIELKTPKTVWSSKGIISEEQKDFIERLRALNYRAEVCYGSEEAFKVIDEYLKGE